MSISPLITFKAGKCEFDASSNPPKIKPLSTPGYIYLYIEDDLVHFCWRPRSAPVTDPELDLLMVPGDGSFLPYTGKDGSPSSEDVRSPTNGRIFVLKFSSSSQRHCFWMQSKSQHPQGEVDWFSPRDQKLGQIVDMLLSGEEVDVADELRDTNTQPGPPGSGDDDDAMEDVQGPPPAPGPQGSGGAGAGATGGDVREEGEESREGGADGARAAPGPPDASAVVRNFLNSIKGGDMSGGASSGAAHDDPFTTLPDLLSSSTTIPIINSAPPSFLDALLSHLPPTILLLAQESSADLAEPAVGSDGTAAVQAAIEALSLEQKRNILARVLRSPQLHQSLTSLTVALRDGGLPTVSESLNIKVENGGFVPGSGMPLGGGQAVVAFLEGVKRTVSEEQETEGKGDESKMETD